MTSLDTTPPNETHLRAAVDPPGASLWSTPAKGSWERPEDQGRGQASPHGPTLSSLSSPSPFASEPTDHWGRAGGTGDGAGDRDTFVRCRPHRQSQRGGPHVAQGTGAAGRKGRLLPTGPGPPCRRPSPHQTGRTLAGGIKCHLNSAVGACICSINWSKANKETSGPLITYTAHSHDNPNLLVQFSRFRCRSLSTVTNETSHDASWMSELQ